MVSVSEVRFGVVLPKFLNLTAGSVRNLFEPWTAPGVQVYNRVNPKIYHPHDFKNSARRMSYIMYMLPLFIKIVFGLWGMLRVT